MPSKKLQSTRVIIAGAGISLIAIVVLLVFNFHLLRSTSQNLTQIDKLHTQKLDIIQNMTHIVRERSLSMLTMYLESDEWKFDEYFMSFHKLALDFIQQKDKLKKHGLTKDEQKEFDKILSIINQTEPMQNTIVDRLQSGNRTGVRTIILTKDLPLEHELLARFDQLTNLIRKNGVKGRIEAHDSYTKSIIKAFFFWLIISLFIIAMMYRALKTVQGIEQGLIDETISLSWKASHDPLTNTYNRRWLEHKIELINNDTRAENNVHSLIYIDLDDFKPINDYYGHSAGDMYLKLFCKQVENHIRQHDTFARIGGDEFVILLDSCSINKAHGIADTIMADINQFTIDYEGNSISANCSIGLLEFGGSNINMHDLLKQADALCYEAKRSGKNQIRQQVTAA